MSADLTPAQAILAVLGPIGAFLATILTLFARRLLLHFDEIAKHLEATRSVDAELTIEMRLSRENRERGEKNREVLDARVIELVRQELTDQRLRDLSQLVMERVSGPPDPPTPPAPPRPEPTSSPDVSGKRRAAQPPQR
jgi:hypothetical protein